jgi:hypothetical protein
MMLHVGLLVSHLLLALAAGDKPPSSCSRWTLHGVNLGMSKEEVEQALKATLTRVGGSSEDNAYILRYPEQDVVLSLTFRHAEARADVSAYLISLEMSGERQERAAAIRGLRETWGAPTDESGCCMVDGSPTPVLEWRDDDCGVYADILTGERLTSIALVSRSDYLRRRFCGGCETK